MSNKEVLQGHLKTMHEQNKNRITFYSAVAKEERSYVDAKKHHEDTLEEERLAYGTQVKIQYADQHRAEILRRSDDKRKSL